ncbi:uncharacterized protein LOC133815564 [Humulus lupulus]|uniref:uncharacterized protein LOC133815564 n=1 Tax=Humulus lupulus TaxID=3486 RepID=UPI002B40D456|nr:uncharacterized protein LOC133815564 [Humulus lupulus]
MIIPKKILNEIAAICRAFLWTGQASSTRPGRIAWDLVCNSKNSGGLGFKDSSDWNIAAIGKYIWAIAEKKDNLWVKWVHHVYIKQVDWWDYIAPVSSSWYWKKIVEVKEKFKKLISVQQVKTEGYQISYGYNIIHTDLGLVHWTKVVWGRLNTPKHSFILWLAIHDRLNTKERLKRHRVIENSDCLLCGLFEESCDHLFFNCSFTIRCYQQVLLWLNWKTESTTLLKVTRWIERAKVSTLRKHVYLAAIAALVYQLWRVRNEVFWLGKFTQPERIVQNTKFSVKTRITYIMPKKLSQKNLDWFRNL